MINYEPLWQTMENRGITTYTLISKHAINPRTINNLKHNKGITVYTLERLCEILNCTPNDIITFTKEYLPLSNYCVLIRGFLLFFFMLLYKKIIAKALYLSNYHFLCSFMLLLGGSSPAICCSHSYNILYLN